MKRFCDFLGRDCQCTGSSSTPFPSVRTKEKPLQGKGPNTPLDPAARGTRSLLAFHSMLCAPGKCSRSHQRYFIIRNYHSVHSGKLKMQGSHFFSPQICVQIKCILKNNLTKEREKFSKPRETFLNGTHNKCKSSNQLNC